MRFMFKKDFSRKSVQSKHCNVSWKLSSPGESISTNSIYVKSVLISISWFRFILVTYALLAAISFLVLYRELFELPFLGNTFSSYFDMIFFLFFHIVQHRVKDFVQHFELVLIENFGVSSFLVQFCLFVWVFSVCNKSAQACRSLFMCTLFNLNFCQGELCDLHLSLELSIYPEPKWEISFRKENIENLMQIRKINFKPSVGVNKQYLFIALNPV